VRFHPLLSESGMADAVAAAQRNLYPRKDGSRCAPEYRDGRGVPYAEALRSLSWPIATDVPSVGQRSAVLHLPEVRHVHGVQQGQMYLHPTTYTKLRHTDHLSFSKSQGELGIGNRANPGSKVFDRLYLGSRSMSRLAKRQSQGRFEMAGDVAFSNSDAEDAVALYTKAIAQAPAGAPNLFAFEKRCSSLAELGRYREALDDAQYILDNTRPAERGSALMRVKAIKDFMKRMDNFEHGYHNATSTLVCLLRPREHRQLVQSNPSTYSRPETATNIGTGLSASASVAKLLQWDKNNDGSIDMDEFREGVEALGYKMKARERNAFSRAADRGFI